MEETSKIKVILTLLLFVTVTLASVSVSYAGYVTMQITNNSYDDGNPQINDNGYVVWSGWDGTDAEIFLYDGTTTTQLTNNSYDDLDPQINNNGYVVWSGWDGTDAEIFLYDGTTTTQLTNNSYNDGHPQINNNGYVVWVGSGGGNWMIFLYNGVGITNISSSSFSFYFPQINDNGYVVWEVFDGSDWEIFLYDGTSITQLTNNSDNDVSPDINNSGYIVWEAWDGSDYEIVIYNGISTTQITNNGYSDFDPKISDNGHVAWQQWDGSDYEMFVYNGTTTTQLTNNAYDDYIFDINDNGYVVWSGWDGSDWEIFLYDGTSIKQLTDNTYDDFFPKVNNNGYIVWERFDGSDREIFLAAPTCGNGILDPGEQCDDGNNIPGDGCSATCQSEVWKDYNGPENPGGYMPDIDQKQDFDNADLDNNPLTGAELHYCAPVAEANSIWWLDKAYHLGIFANPEDGIGYIGQDINGDTNSNILDLVQDLANLMGTNVQQPGTLVEDEQAGIEAFFAKYPELALNDRLYEHTEYQPEFSYIEEEVERSQDVKLDLGFWHVESVEGHPGDWIVTWRRVGGHAVTVAGVASNDFTLAISDPYFDAAEGGAPGVVRPGPHGYPHDPTVHNIEAFASHDIYTVVPSISPGGKWALHNYPVAWPMNFPPDFEYNNGPPIEVVEHYTEPAPPVEVCMTFAEIEAAVIVSPKPIIDRLRPRSCEPGTVIRIIGTSFGNTQGDSVVHIGPRIFDSSSPRIRLWSDNRIRIRIPNYRCEWFRGQDYRRVKVWVTVNGIDSNWRRLRVLKPGTCP
jgi:cysteine-rich repeat protein